MRLLAFEQAQSHTKMVITLLMAIFDWIWLSSVKCLARTPVKIVPLFSHVSARICKCWFITSFRGNKAEFYIVLITTLSIWSLLRQYQRRMMFQFWEQWPPFIYWFYVHHYQQCWYFDNGYLRNPHYWHFEAAALFVPCSCIFSLCIMSIPSAAFFLHCHHHPLF